MSGQLHALAALPPGKIRYPLYRRLGGPKGQSGRVRKISPPPGFDPRTVQPVAGRYTNWVIPAPRKLRLQTDIPVSYLVDAGFLSQPGQRLFRLPQSLQNNGVSVPHVRAWPLPPIPFPIIYTVITSPVDAVWKGWLDRRATSHIKFQLRQEPCVKSPSRTYGSNTAHYLKESRLHPLLYFICIFRQPRCGHPCFIICRTDSEVM